MTTVEWDPKARKHLRKLPTNIARRIFRKVDQEVKAHVHRYLETLANRDDYKIRVGDYRLFADYDPAHDLLSIRAIRHRRTAYKR